MEDPELKEKKSPLNELINLIERLRGPDGCPWDKKQVPQSIVIYLIEEIYELADAIRSGSPDDICEELGDVLFHIFFIAKMFQEKEHFSIDDVARLITEKMIRRHPHVFASQKVKSTEDIKQNWHKIKLSEKNNEAKDSILDSVPTQLPALLRAYMVSDRIARAGFEPDKGTHNLLELERKLVDLKSVLPDRENKKVDQQCGDFLFSFVNFVRSMGIHPETSLAEAVKRFEGRFKRVEKQIADSGRTLEKVSQTEKDQIWEK